MRSSGPSDLMPIGLSSAYGFHGVRAPLFVEAVSRQDSEGAPSLELAPERRMSFCWFQPEGPQRLKLRLGPKEPLS